MRAELRPSAVLTPGPANRCAPPPSSARGVTICFIDAARKFTSAASGAFPHYFGFFMSTSQPRLVVTPSATILSDAERTARMSNLSFGRTFTDHMALIPYRDGAWQQGDIKAYG